MRRGRESWVFGEKTKKKETEWCEKVESCAFSDSLKLKSYEGIDLSWSASQDFQFGTGGDRFVKRKRIDLQKAECSLEEKDRSV